MHYLVQAASRALVKQNADELERLVEAARSSSVRPLSLNIRELAGAVDVLAKQVKAAETHLGLQAKAIEQNERNPWGL